MARKKETPKPLFTVKHDFVDSLDAFIQASIMQNNAISTVLSLTKPGDPMPESVRALLKERSDAWEKATLSQNEDETP